MKLQLALNNTSDYRVVIPVNGDIRNKHAAGELVHYFEKITGVRLAIVTDDVPAQDAEICVGPAARDCMPEVSGLKNDGFVMKSVDSRI